MRIHKTIQFTVPEECDQLRLDKALSQHPEIDSRSLASRLIAKDCVKQNNKVMKASYKVSTGEIFDVDLPAKDFEDLLPYEFQLDIVHEDEEVIVINKSSGMVVHPAAGHYQDTLINALLFHNKQLSSGSAEFRPGLVHRLDKDTSGLLVIAKNDRCHRILAKQFKDKTVDRRYQALTYGRFHEREGKIESHLIRHIKDRKKFMSFEKLNPMMSAMKEDREGKYAATNYKVLGEHPSGLSFVELRLETGRTHQIRVHLSEMGHGIVGDPIYSNKNRAKDLTGVKWKQLIGTVPRLMLHAFELGFKHPNGLKMHFERDWGSEDLQLLTELDFK